MWVCEFDEALYKQGYEELNDELYDITDFRTSEITGNIKVKNDGLMFTSIPYEKGWKAYVDDVEAEIVSGKRRSHPSALHPSRSE